MTLMRPCLPTGTVTFLFTDVEGSTRLLQELGDDYAGALSDHRSILRRAFSAHGGVEVDTQGDAFFVAFPTASAAARAAAQVMENLSSGPIRVRIGVHTGTPEIGEEGYVGVDVVRAARIAAIGHGGQVLVSAATAALLDREEIRDLGEHRLKDLPRPQRLYQLVIPGLAAEFPALKTLEDIPTNLPTQPTPLIGREEELAQTADLLRADETRVLTLTGAGGTGKTRLALQLAADMLDEFPEGVFVVELVAIREPSLVLPTIAQALAVRELPGLPLDQTLVEHLRDRRLLLLLDNFEHLLAGAPPLAALLAGAPHVKLLVTSRVSLRLAGEREYAVPPLELPDAEQLPDVDALSKYEAIALFLQRARAVRSSFELTDGNARAVAETCVRLDGLPLAIELAAARIRALTPQGLVARLDQRLTLLSSGPRDAPARQQTLRAAIDWSYALLTRQQQRLLCRLSVFVGGCDLEAAETVCGFDGKLDLDVLEGISSLIENSLLVVNEDPRGETRYSMLETIREYASEKLEGSGEAEALRRQHAEYFGALADQGTPTMHYLAPAEWDESTPIGHSLPLADAPEERAHRELPNLRAALQWTFDKGDLELALRLVVAASWGWALNSTYTEARVWLTRAVDETEHLQTLARARALFWFAEFAAWQGEFRRAETFNQRARALFEQHHDRIGVFRSLLGLTQFEVSLGDLKRARAVLEEAGTLAETLGSSYERAWLCFKAAQVEGLSGDYLQAHARLEEGLQLCRKLDVPRRQWVNQLINVGWFAMQQHDFVRARAALEEYLAEDSGKTPAGMASAHNNLGLMALYEVDREGAVKQFLEALALARRAGAKRTIATAMYGLAAVAAIEGDVGRSTRLWVTADVIRRSTSSPLSTPEQFVLDRYLRSDRDTHLDEIQPTDQAGIGSMGIDEALAHAFQQLNFVGDP